MSIVSKEYVFKTVNNKLTFIGDFEAFYKNEKDPWGQSGKDKRLKKYYNYSRNNLLNCINNLKNVSNIVEIGCGNGHVSNIIQSNTNLKVTGIDISQTAIHNAKKLYPKCKFITNNVCNSLTTHKKYNIVLLSELLWYILEDLNIVFDNINKMLKNNGYVIFEQGFLKDQKYGKNIIDGFNGLLKYILLNHFNDYKLIKAEIVYNKYPLDNGIIILKKNN